MHEVIHGWHEQEQKWRSLILEKVEEMKKAMEVGDKQFIGVVCQNPIPDDYPYQYLMVQKVIISILEEQPSLRQFIHHECRRGMTNMVHICHVRYEVKT